MEMRACIYMSFKLFEAFLYFIQLDSYTFPNMLMWISYQEMMGECFSRWTESTLMTQESIQWYTAGGSCQQSVLEYGGVRRMRFTGSPYQKD